MWMTSTTGNISKHQIFVTRSLLTKNWIHSYIKKNNSDDKESTNQIYLFSIKILSQECCSGQNFIPLSFWDLIQFRSYHQQWDLVITKLLTVIVTDEGNKYNPEWGNGHVSRHKYNIASSVPLKNQ